VDNYRVRRQSGAIRLILHDLWKARPVHLNSLLLRGCIPSSLHGWVIKAARIAIGIERLDKIEREGRRPVSLQ
jgi:hypothetical protein